MSIPEQILAEWEQRNGPAALSTVSNDGMPNVVYTAFVSQYGDDAFIITDHFFSKTRDNILQGSRGALVFMSGDGRRSYQLKGEFEYHKDGDVLEKVRASMPPNLPSKGAAILRIKEVYSGAARLD